MNIIETTHLFPKLNDLLVQLAENMDQDDWHKKTHFPNWTVKDIFTHLLDTSVRRLSSERDKYVSLEKPKIECHQDLIDYITQMADRWALAFTNVSPTIIIEMINKYQNDLYEYLVSLDPFGISKHPVSWAGEQESYNWFDIAREYTERWHHQMQIREVLGNTNKLYKHELYYPILDTFMQALPYHYSKLNEKKDYTLKVSVTGDNIDSSWFLESTKNIRELKYNSTKQIDAYILVDEKIAWKILTKWNEKELENTVNIRGDIDLGQHFLGMTCLMI